MIVVVLNGCVHIRDESLDKFVKVNRTNLRKALFKAEWLPHHSKRQLVQIIKFNAISEKGKVYEKDVNRVQARLRGRKRRSL